MSIRFVLLVVVRVGKSVLCGESERDKLSETVVESGTVVYSEFESISEVTSKNSLNLVLQEWL